MTAGLCLCTSVLVGAQHAKADRGRPEWSKYAPTNANKVIICHKDGPVKFQPLSVASRALPAHVAHGDCVVDDGVSCTVDSCDAALGCVHAPDNSLCDDGDACTNDTCDPTAGCVYSPVNCDDHNACTTDFCDPASGCRNIDVPTCGACCLSDDSCLDDRTAEECTGQGGEPQGQGTDCTTTQCCIPPFDTGCTTYADCCNFLDCNNGTCCNAIGFECGGVDDDGPCCDPNAICSGNICCIPDFRSCTRNSECCSGLCTSGLCEGLIEP